MAHAESPTADSPDRDSQGSAQRDERLFGELHGRFVVLADACRRLSREVFSRADGWPEGDRDESLRRHMSIVRRALGGRLLEILGVLYVRDVASFDELFQILGGHSKQKLSVRLGKLEGSGLVQRNVPNAAPESARYTLTDKGTVIARLGEPVILYLRLAEGWTAPLPAEEETASEDPAGKPGST